MLEKVTAFVIRKLASGPELLLFEHPFAGIQIPAGTVKPGESPQVAVLREVAEETGLTDVVIEAAIDSEDTLLPKELTIVMHPTTVFSQPDPSSFNWARMESGTWVKALRRRDGYTQVSYEEPDRLPNPTYTTYQITGWVPDEVLTQLQRRHFFLMRFSGSTPPTWKVYADNHTFRLFWAPLDEIPALIPPQDTWLDHLTKSMGK